MKFAPKKKGLAALAALPLLIALAIGVPATAANAAEKCTTRESGTTRTTNPSRAGEGFSVGYRDAIRNNTKKAISGSCTSTTSKTITYTAGATVEATVSAWVFAQVKASVNATVASSVATGFSTSAVFPIAANSTTYCDRGSLTQLFRTPQTRQTFLKRNGAYYLTKSESLLPLGSAPTRPMWKIWN